MQSGCVLRREDAMEKIKNIRKKLRHQRSVRRRKLGLSTPTQIICVSFIIVIALGTLLLTLPIASRHGCAGRMLWKR